MKKFLTVFFAFTLYFNLISQANAASLGGWTLGNPIAQGASAIVNGTKTAVINGANVIKNSTAKITPPASAVAKVLARGAAGYALSVAVEQLLGSVDWVLDPANNRIVYKTGESVYVIENDPSTSADSKLEACRLFAAKQNSTFYDPTKYYIRASDNTCGVWFRSWAGYAHFNIGTTTQPSEEKYLPLPVVAQKVISNAAAGDASAQQAIVAAAQDIINEAETDNTKARPIVNQLEANAETATDETATGEAAPKADPATGEQAPPIDISIEFPKFCTWAPVVCEAAQIVISFPQTLTNWWETAKSKAEEWANSISEAWTAVKEWAKSDTPEDTELEIPDPEQPEIDTEIAFGGSCPADHQAEINMGVGVIKMPISYEPICTTVSTAKPVLIFVGFFIAALIIGGVKTE